MNEFVLIVVGIVVVAGLVAFAAATIDQILRKVERGLTFAAAALILFSMLFVTAEVFMRYVFNSPLPGHLEGSELLVPIIVFFAISYTQSQRGHVGMTLVVDSMSQKWRDISSVVTLLLSIFICSVISYFSATYAWDTWNFEEVTMSPPYYPIWPSAAAIPIGYFLVAVRMYIQLLYIVMPNRITEPAMDESELSTAE